MMLRGCCFLTGPGILIRLDRMMNEKKSNFSNKQQTNKQKRKGNKMTAKVYKTEFYQKSVDCYVLSFLMYTVHCSVWTKVGMMSDTIYLSFTKTCHFNKDVWTFQSLRMFDVTKIRKVVGQSFPHNLTTA